MTVEDAMKLIFDHVNAIAKARGFDTRVKWPDLEDRLEIPHEIFVKAIRALTKNGAELVLRTPDEVCLGPGGR